MGLFFLNFLGNVNTDGSWSPSKKAFFFSVANIIAWVVPLALLKQDIITGEQFLDYLKIIVPATLFKYVVGKFVDLKGNGQ